MLANLKIIWQFHTHPVHQKVSRLFGPRYIGDDFYLGPNLVSFNRVIVPYEISKVNFHVNSGFQWYWTYETSGSPSRFMLRRSSLVECVSVLHGTGVYKASIFFSSTVCSAMFVKKFQVHILYHKE